MCEQVIAKVRNEKAKRFLSNMRDKQSIPFSRQFQGADPKALSLLKRMLAFDPQERPSAVEALRDEYFAGLANEAREPSATPISSYAFQFESRKLDLHDVRRLIYEEILEFHPLEKDRYREMKLLEQQRSMEYHRAPNGVPAPGFEYVDRVRLQGFFWLCTYQRSMHGHIRTIVYEHDPLWHISAQRHLPSQSSGYSIVLKSCCCAEHLFTSRSGPKQLPSVSPEWVAGPGAFFGIECAWIQSHCVCSCGLDA